MRACRGAEGCPHAVGDVAGAAEALRGVLVKTRAAEVVREKAGGLPRVHDQLTIAVSGCPNACSQPQIADFGLIGAEVPQLHAEACVGCGACVEACREAALELHGSALTLVPERCLACGACIRACDYGALTAGESGWRALVGGRLGRHPRLAQELDGYHPLERVEATLETIVELWSAVGRPHERIGALLERVSEDRDVPLHELLRGGVRS